MTIHETEIFGPVVVILRADSLDDAIRIINDHQYGNGGSIYTQNGYWARKFKLETNCGMIGVNVGMWFERFVIVVTSLSRDYLPTSWGYYRPTAVDVLTFVGSFGLFFTLFLLFVWFLPIIGMAEVKGVMPQAHLDRPGHHGHGDYHGDIHGMEVLS